MTQIYTENDAKPSYPSRLDVFFNMQTNSRSRDFAKRALGERAPKVAGNIYPSYDGKQLRSVYKRQNILFCIDIEAWEQDTRNKTATEIGIAIYDPRKQKMALAPNIETLHLVIKEREHLRNGRYVEDNKDSFMGIDSHKVSLANALKIVQGLVDHYFNFSETRKFPCLFVGHGLNTDMDYLRAIGVSIPADAGELDTQQVYAKTHGLNGASLTNCLRALKQPFAYLHNAGNDAYYTLLLALKLCDPEVRQVSGFERSAESNATAGPSRVKSLIKKFSLRG